MERFAQTRAARRRPSRAVRLFAIAWALVFLGPGAAAANKESHALRKKAFDLAYNLDHEDALAALRQAVAADPQDPAAYRGLASITWLNLLFRRGAITVDDYLGSVTKPNIAVKEPPADLAAQFQQNVAKALELAERGVQSNARNVDAHYHVGATVGLQASYAATIEGRVLGAFRAARRAYSAHEEVLRLDATRKDAGLIVGTYRYVVSALALPVRMMAYVVGFGGGKERGLQMIEEAAGYESEAQTDARFSLILIYNREKRYDDALRVLGGLQRAFPRNRLLWLEAGATALRAGRAVQSEAILSEGLGRLARDTRPRAFGEEATWRYKRGAARVALGRRDEARADLQAALKGQSRDWIRGRTHLELGKLADLAGQREAARAEYQRALQLCEGDNDSIGAREAERLRSTAYKRQ